MFRVVDQLVYTVTALPGLILVITVLNFTIIYIRIRNFIDLKLPNLYYDYLVIFNYVTVWHFRNCNVHSLTMATQTGRNMV